jgi:hypothetical protein
MPELLTVLIAKVSAFLIDFDIEDRLALCDAVLDEGVNLIVGDQRTLAAHGLCTAGRHIEHVPLADEVFGAFAIENDAAVERRGNLEGDAGGNVRLDDASDHIRARRLCGDNEVNAGRTRHLRDAGDGDFDVRRRGLHQIGQLIDDDDDVGHRIRE